MYRGKTIGVAMPAYNEGKLIEKTLSSIPVYVDKIYAVNDGSKDDTGEKIRNFTDKRVTYIEKENGGVGSAICAGYKRALADSIDIVAVMAGDNQMDGNYLPGLLNPIIDGYAEYTKGNRLINSEYRKGMSAWRSLGNYILTFLNKLASGYWDIDDPQNGYTAISSCALEQINLDKIYKGYAFENDILVKLNIYDIPVLNVPIPARYAEEQSKIRYSRFIVKTSFFFVCALNWRAWKKYAVRLNPIGWIYLTGSVFSIFGIFALFMFKPMYIMLGFSMFGVASFAEILRNKVKEARFFVELEKLRMQEW